MPIEPTTPKELSEALAEAASRGKTISLGGHFSKRAMGGPVAAAEVNLATSRLSKILQYEPADLTLSVEAGASWAELCRVLAKNRQMIPLDPPFAESATVGGVVATNGSGPRRRLYGSARDLVIGMRFATLDGKEVQSGGMVVKNVAGLDMGKLMIGSFGTLAAILTVNFKLTPMPEVEKTSLLKFESADAALDARDRLIRGVLQPSAVDLLNPAASAEIGRSGYLLAVGYGGNAAVVARYAREVGGEILEGSGRDEFWRAVIQFPERFLESYMGSTVVRVSTVLTQLREVVPALDSASVPVIARAANGVVYGYFDRTTAAEKWIADSADRIKSGWRCAIDFAPDQEKIGMNLWPEPGDDFEMMKNVKRMFDPRNLLNHGRLYGRI